MENKPGRLDPKTYVPVLETIFFMASLVALVASILAGSKLGIGINAAVIGYCFCKIGLNTKMVMMALTMNDVMDNYEQLLKDYQTLVGSFTKGKSNDNTPKTT